MAVQQLFCEVLPPGFVQYCSQHSCVISSSFFSIRLVNFHIMHPYRSRDTTAAWKNLRFIFIVQVWTSDNLSIAIHAFVNRCWCPSRLMRHCFLSRWTCPLVSENYHLVWRCHLFYESTCIASCLRWHEGLCQQLLVPEFVAGFLLGAGYICQKHYVIGVVRIRNCLFGGISSFFPLPAWKRYLSCYQ